MRRLLTISFLLAVLLAYSSPPRLLASTSALTMTAQAAFDGHFKYGEWLPIFVNLENAGPDLSGEIRASITSQTGRLNFVVPAELPAGARKRFTLYTLPNNFSHSLKVELVSRAPATQDEEGEVLLSQEVELSLLPNDRYVIGVVMADLGGIATLNPPQLPGRRERAKLVGLTLADLPDRPEGLRLLNTLILNDVDTSLLTPAQGTALRSWVAGGGRLVLGGGAGAGRTLAGLPPDLQPVSLTNQQEVMGLPGLEAYTGEPVRVPGPFLLAGGQPVPKATVLLYQAETEPELETETQEPHSAALAGPEGLPLLVELDLGAGHVDFIALDLTQSPFDAWAGAAEFVTKLLSPGAGWPNFLPPDVAPQQMSDSQMSYALTNLPALDLPSVRLLGLLLAGYIILVGPANYFFLRWRDRLAWAWVTIPGLTLAFSGLAYGLGFSLRGSSIIVNQISLIELSADGQATQARTYVGVFSPSRQAYDIEVEQETLIRPLGEGGYDPWSGSVRTSGTLSVVQGEPARVRGLAVNQWSMQSFVAETVPVEVPGLVAQLTAEREGLRGHLINQSSVTWQDVIIIFNAQFQKLGDLAPGQTVDVQLDFSQNAETVMGFGSYMLYQDEFNGPTGPSREVMFKQSLLDNTVFNSNRASLADSPMLIAWQENSSPLQINLAGRQISNQKTSFLYGALPISFDGPQVAVPPGFSQIETLTTSGDAGECNYGPGMVGYHLYQGAAETKLSLPASLADIQPARLDLYVRTDGGWPALPAVELYDQLKEEWVPLEGAKLGVNPIQEVERFYDQSDASLQLRVSSKLATGGGGCLFFELALEGERL